MVVVAWWVPFSRIRSLDLGTEVLICTPAKTWRRRHFRLVGASLVAYNDITKKPTAKIDLRKAVRVEDETISLPSGGETLVNTPQVLRRKSSFNALSGIEHSFRIVFPDDDICFYADTAEEKKRW